MRIGAAVDGPELPNASGLRNVASTISPPSPEETHTFTRPSAIT